MMILDRHQTEGDALEQIFREKFKLTVTEVVPCRPLDRGFEFARPNITIYSYVGPSSGKTRWIIESERFAPPDALLWDSWIVDELPSDEQIALIVNNDLQKGSML